jgi:hypothetical protein
LAPRYGFTPLVGLGFYREVPGDDLEATVSWDDPNAVSKSRQAAVAIAQQYQPKYLALGGEINRYYEHDPAGFDQFVTTYAGAYDAIKAISPQTLVFPVLQLEMTKGGAYLVGGSETRQPQWELLDRFAPDSLYRGRLALRAPGDRSRLCIRRQLRRASRLRPPLLPTHRRYGPRSGAVGFSTRPGLKFPQRRDGLPLAAPQRRHAKARTGRLARTRLQGMNECDGCYFL